MIFARPYILLGLILVPSLGFFLLWANSQQRRALGKLGDGRLIQRLSANVNWRGRRWQAVLHLTALALFIVALARPQWGSEVREINQEGLQVMVALDVSQSMLAQDIKPNRLARAKLEIADLMDRLDGDEIGLALFSGASFLQVPLTSDYVTALNYLDSANPQVISRPGTVIGDAIRTAADGFDPNLTSQKVLVLMTDGEDRETDPLAAAREVAGEDVLIYAIGFGTPDGQPVPETDARGDVLGYKTDEQGQVVLSKLDEQTLQEIASVGQGQYYRATADGRELDALLAEIDTLQTAQLESRYDTRHIDRFQIFLALALAALIISELIPDRLTERTIPVWVGRLWRRRYSRSRTLSSQA
jgi:Ca-activated chloride channel family protein